MGAAVEVLLVRFCAICAPTSPVLAMGGSGTSWIIERVDPPGVAAASDDDGEFEN